MTEVPTMRTILKCVAVPKKICRNRYLREMCKKEQLPLCIIKEPVIRVDENNVLHGCSHVERKQL